MPDTKYDLVGAKEAAEILDINTPNFSHLRNDEAKKGGDSIFPAPVLQLACGPIWERADIVKFSQVYRTRKPGVKAAVKPTNGAVKPVNGTKVVRKQLPRPK